MGNGEVEEMRVESEKSTDKFKEKGSGRKIGRQIYTVLKYKGRNIKRRYRNKIKEAKKQTY